MPLTIPELFFSQARQYGAKPLFLAKREGAYRPITWEQARRQVEALSAFLLHRGVTPGDRVLLLSENRPEWGVADLAIQSIGAWTVPLYPSLTEDDVVNIARDCQPVVGIASTQEQVQKLHAAQRHVTSLRTLMVMDAAAPLPAMQPWAEALGQGSGLCATLQSSLRQRRQALTADHTATLIYTSGTTGEPKGVRLSHQNFLSNAASCLTVFSLSSTDTHLSFLPLSHVFERMAGWYLMLMVGASIAYAENMETIPQNMREVRPTIMLGVPRFFEKLYARVQEGIQQASPLKRRLAQWAVSIGQRMSPHRLARTRPPLGLQLQHRLADLLVFRALRRRLGGRLRFFVSGSAPLSKTIGEFFYAAGITILEGYGLTETSPVIAVNRPEALKFGTVGQPIEGVEVRIADDGEILTRGPHVMQGYYQKPRETAEAIVEGWFHTGDIGHLDEEGFLVITDRKKDLIKTSGGKFVAPQKLETLFVTDPYITQAFVYGDRERYCVALIVPNVQRLSAYAQEQGIVCAPSKDFVQLPAIHEFLWTRIQALQQSLASFEQVKAIAVLDQEFTQASGELTPTMKAKRSLIAANHAEIIRQLYASSSHAN